MERETLARGSFFGDAVEILFRENLPARRHEIERNNGLRSGDGRKKCYQGGKICVPLIWLMGEGEGETFHNCGVDSFWCL